MVFLVSALVFFPLFIFLADNWLQTAHHKLDIELRYQKNYNWGDLAHQPHIQFQSRVSQIMIACQISPCKYSKHSSHNKSKRWETRQQWCNPHAFIISISNDPCIKHQYRGVISTVKRSTWGCYNESHSQQHAWLPTLRFAKRWWRRRDSCNISDKYARLEFIFCISTSVPSSPRTRSMIVGYEIFAFYSPGLVAYIIRNLLQQPLSPFHCRLPAWLGNHQRTKPPQ